jgi:hypothetical protein
MPLKILFTVALLVPAMAIAQGRPLVSIDSNLYPYQSQIDNDTDLTFITNARLPARFSYFSYINFRGATTGDAIAFTRSEQTLRWGISENLPLDLSFQAVLVDGSGNDFSQLGISWPVHNTPGLSEFFDRINLIYRITFQLKRFGSTDNKVWQTEQYFKMKFPGLSERVYLSGFIDQTFDLDHADALPKNPVVLEVQAGVRLWKNFYGVAEYRVNDFRLGNEYNLAAGIEYQHAWR